MAVGVFALVGLAVLAILAVPVTVIVLVVKVAAQNRRIEALERAVGRLAEAERERPAPAIPAAAPPLAPSREAAPERPATPGPEAGPEPGPAAAPAPDYADVWRQAAESAGAAPVRMPPPPVASGPPAGDRGLAWLAQNWFYAVSAISLGLAGIFLVQYGIEQGLLSPVVRVSLALGFGAALIVAGEVIRRRSGDGEETATAYLPSTFSAAGIVVLYAAILSARGLYDLIGAEAALVGLTAVSALALVFGWFYGPFLAAAGLTGAAAAPFLVGGAATSGMPLYGFYGLLAGTGLAIDAVRRWGWVSAVALGLAYLGGSAVHLGGGEIEGFLALVLWLAVAAIALPRLELWPSHPGPALSEVFAGRASAAPVPPTLIAAAGVAATGLLIAVATTGEGPAAELLGLILLGGLALGLVLWTHRADGLPDLALVPAVLFLGLIVTQATGFGDLYREVAVFDRAATPEAAAPRSVTILLGLAALVSAAAAWRSFRGRYPAAWAAAAAVFAPLAAVLFELFWQPAAALGAYSWAGHVIALAALMTLLAERFARADGEDRRRAAYATLSALSLIALALFILLADAALTVALSVLVVAAAALDRRFGLPEMGLFLVAGVATLAWRLLIDPGLPAYFEVAPLAEVLLAFGAALGGLFAARAVLPDGREDMAAVLETALWAFGGAFASVLLARAILGLAPAGGLASHWGATLFGLVWAGVALAQYWRTTVSDRLAGLGRAVAAVFGVMAAAAFGAALTALNPMFAAGSDILGVQPADTLTVAYLLPALVFTAIAAKARWLPWRSAAGWGAGGFLAVWVFLEIRWFWQGDAIASGLFSQPELYSYTVALLIAGGLLLYQAIARQSAGLRRLAVAVIAVAVAKVFLVDASGLTGLLRVFSFLALGLVLAGLAWLNRWAAARQGGAAA